MIKNYLSVVFQIVAALTIGIGAIIMSHLLGKKGKRSDIKDAPYECGKKAETFPQTFDVRFYRVAMLFLLFDIEVVFLYPWAVDYTQMIAGHLGPQVLWIALAFVLIIEVGHLYAYKKGIFDWYKR
ncbi:MAG: NADH-quinone oxidoreductase subunit A [Verrucomicrobiota bacterium]